ncbi:MAG TPA: GTPase [Actinomycetales bacterium]|nr:GTPase [Actinomycetales bacterium]
MSRREKGIDLVAQATALQEALAAGGHRLDDDAVRRARALLAKVDERTRLSADHTVVALAGATGSGKSSLFNALAGLDLATVGARRPTTSTVSACVWGSDGAEALLDWLAVPRRHRASHESALDDGRADELRGLVLLDLPDYDSTEVTHRREVDRLLELVDVFVWVTDPQKYADAALHRQYLARLAGHDAVTVVVLNQADRLTPVELAACERDLQRLVAADGLRDVPVIATSATAGTGVEQLRARVVAAVRQRNAWSERLAADLRSVSVRLRAGVADAEATSSAAVDESVLVDALAGAAGVPAVVQAVRSHYVRGAVAAGGWPFTRWVAGLRPDPLKRFRLRTMGSSDDAVRTARSSLPAPTPAARARVELATRQVADAASAGLPTRWADAVRAAADPSGPDLADALDQAVLGADLDVTSPAWWRVVAAAQWVLAAAAILGGAWLIVLAVLGALRLPQPVTPYAGWVPVPTLLLLGGLVLGLLLAGVVRRVAGTTARHRAEAARRQLLGAVSAVARDRVRGPVSAVLADHRSAREALDVVTSGRSTR